MTGWNSWPMAGLALGILLALAGAAYWITVSSRVVPLAPEAVDLSALDQVPPESWARLREKRIYFGHQSVGANVIDGLVWILERKPQIGLRIVTTAVAESSEGPGLIHGPVGTNGDTQSKITDFKAFVTGPAGSALDIAVMKFCYADIGRQSDPAQVLDDYRAMVADVTAARPDLRVVHSTVPLTWVPTGPKPLIKKLLGRRPELDNVQRGQYNNSLRSAYGPESIFDIAAAESRTAAGDTALLQVGGEAWPAMASELTDDGGHLNPGGQVLLARELLLSLVRQLDAMP
jgi:lysophospholipase L1-like esterase